MNLLNAKAVSDLLGVNIKKAYEIIRQLNKELESKGVLCEPIRFDSYTGKPMTFFRDPDGLPIEIHE